MDRGRSKDKLGLPPCPPWTLSRPDFKALWQLEEHQTHCRIRRRLGKN